MADKKDDENLTPVEPRATKGEPIGPGDPVQVDSIMGKDTKKPGENSTFATRAKAVSSSSAENKSVSSSRASKK